MTVFGTGFSPQVQSARLPHNPVVNTTITAATLTTGSGARTVTAAEVLQGIFVFNVDDAQTMTLPTAALWNAAVEGNKIGAMFGFLVINTGDADLTLAVGTGGTLVVGNSKSTVATVASNASKIFYIRVTGIKQAGDASDSYQVISQGSVAASVA